MEFGKEYIKLFETEAEYLVFTASTEYILPNVSHIKQSDNTHYAPLITIADAVITCNSVTYNGEAQSATISVALSGQTLVKDTDYTISGTTSGTNAGDYSFTINGIGNYKGSKNGTFTINKVTPTVTAPTVVTSLVYDNSSQALVNAGSTDWGTLKYSLDNSTYSTSIPSGTNAGNYTIYYKVEGNSNINDVAAQSLSNSIAKVTPTVVAPTAKVLTYNGSAQELVNAGSTDYGTLQYRAGSDSWSTSIPTRTRGGSYTVEYKVVGDSNINDVAAQSVSCSISEKPVTATVTLSQTAYTYNGSACQPTPTVSDGGTVIDPSEYSIAYSNNVNAGTGTVTISDNVGGDYNVIGSATFTINKANPTYTAPTATSPTYNGSAQNLLNAGSTSHGTIQYSSDNSSWSTTIPTSTNANTYTSYWRLVGDSNHNDVASTSISTTIAKADQTAPTATGSSVTYGNTATATASGGGGNGSIEWNNGNTLTGNVGSKTTKARWGGNDNYNPSPYSNEVTLSITKANGSVTTAPTAKSLTYTGSAQALVNAGSGTGTMMYKLDSGAWGTSIPTATNATSYTVYYKASASTNYNESASGSVACSIAKANQSAPTATGATTTYSTTATATASGGGGQGSLEWESAQSQTSVGSHSTRARWSGNSNYNASPWSNSVTVQMNKANQSAPTATGATVNYGSTATATASGGGGQGTLTWTNGNTRTSIGSQTTQAYWSGNGNYNASPYSNSVTLTVNDPYAGHAYVEIGGLKWATMNIGASNVTDAGLYFQWGDTQGYTASQVGSGSGQKYFGWADYKYGNGTSEPGATGMTKYYSTDGKTVLDASDDAARANWGGQWRMPTRDEFKALGSATTSAWTADYQGSGVPGLILTDNNDSSKVLFFPAAGGCKDGTVHNVDSQGYYYGYYWSRSLYTYTRDCAYYSWFRSNSTNWGSYTSRYRGFSVRGVVG